jgi:hypothetical protein
MPTYKATLHLRDSQQLLDNDYSFNCHVNAANTNAAFERAIEVAESLAGTVLPPNISVYRLGVSNTDVVNGTRIENGTYIGTRTVTGSALPAWNVARVQFRVASGVRPVTFFLRMGLTENDVDGQVLESTTIGDIESFISAFLLTGANCDRYGFQFVSGSVDQDVRMRQTAWRRRTRPGYKRGWVPV